MKLSTILLFNLSSIALAAVAPALPTITPPPSLERLDLKERQDVDLGSLADVLVTAVPPSILALALTNVPAVSKLLWSEFLDDNTPAWFTALPSDIQAYLSGQYGPTTAASNSASSTVASSSASATSSSPAATENARVADDDKHDGGLPLWAKIVIGIVVPLVVLGLVALLLIFCWRRPLKRRRAARAARLNVDSRTPTPAFISSSYRPQASNPPGEQHIPLRGGYHSGPDSNHDMSQSSRHISSDSEEYRTPIGGPSYEDLPPAGIAHHSRRGSRQSLNSLHSVPEVPEPMHQRRNVAPIPLPPRSPRRSRDFSQEANPVNSRRISPLNPAYGAGYNGQDRSMPSHPYSTQGIYAGGHNPYPSPYTAYSPDRYLENPFNDPPNGYRSERDETFIPGRSYRQSGGNGESEWPLKAVQDGGYHEPAGGARRSWGAGDRVYEM